jgi:hypothetical protein
MERFNPGADQSQNPESQRPPFSEADLNALAPQQIDFFGMGTLESSGRKSDVSSIQKWPIVVSFRFIGGEVGFCTVAFEQVPELAGLQDESMATEMANLLAAKLATSLAEREGELIELTPPSLHRKGEAKHRYLTAAMQTSLKYVYSDRNKGKLSIALAYLPSLQGQG